MMKRFRLMVAIVSMVIFCFPPVKAEWRWDEHMLRTDLEAVVNKAFKKVERKPMIIRDEISKQIACAELCKVRIKLLKKLLKNAIFLPADVAEYVRSGLVPPASREAVALEKVAVTKHHQEDWKPVIGELISTYESIKLGYTGFD